MSAAKKGFGLCGPDCLYRTLYEGSQASLSDMAGKQAGALSRVGRLRQGIVDSLKQTFPVEFGDAEANLGKRMSSVDDEVLLAYLTAFLAMPKAATAARAVLSDPSPTQPAAGLSALREALAAAGIALPADDNPDLWADSVRTWAGKRTPPQVSTQAPAAPGMAPVVTVSDARMIEDPFRHEPRLDEHPIEEPGFDPAHPGLDADFPTSFPDAPEVPFDPQDPGDYTHADYTHGDISMLDSLFGPDAADAVTPAAEAVPGAEELASWASLFDEPATPSVPEAPAHAPLTDSPEPSTTAEPEPLPPLPPLPFADPDRVTDPAGRAKEPVEDPAVVAPSPASLPPNAVSTRESGPIKPEAPTAPGPARKSRRRPTKKVARVTANAPGSADPRGELAQVSGAAELTDEIREKLLATVYMPRPVFVADLAHLIDNADLVEQWKDECHAQGPDSPVRFLAAKARHRARGALIIPRADNVRGSSDFETSVWRQCIDSNSLRGAKLYELAVLLHRVLDNLVTLDIGDDVVTLRLAQTRGLVGVILVLSGELGEDSQARVELGRALDGMARGRLSLLALCSYTSTAGAVPDLAQAARAEIDAAQLAPAFPVIAQASWEFAADGGTSAISVLG